jgi:hypothetical protein
MANFMRVAAGKVGKGRKLGLPAFYHALAGLRGDRGGKNDFCQNGNCSHVLEC